MSACRCLTQYNEGFRVFVEFAVSNCTSANGKFYCSCKYCQNNQRHAPDYVLAHLTGGRGMALGYSLWYMHSETASGSAVPGRCLSHPSVQIRLPVALNRVNAQNRAEAWNRVLTCAPCCVTPSTCTMLVKPSVANRKKLMKEPLEGTH